MSWNAADECRAGVAGGSVSGVLSIRLRGVERLPICVSLCGAKSESAGILLRLSQHCLLFRE
jgi:hypothetical protein